MLQKQRVGLGRSPMTRSPSVAGASPQLEVLAWGKEAQKSVQKAVADIRRQQAEATNVLFNIVKIRDDMSTALDALLERFEKTKEELWSEANTLKNTISQNGITQDELDSKLSALSEGSLPFP